MTTSLMQGGLAQSKNDSRTVADSALVSVVVPTFNRPELVIRALRSVLRQTYGNLEVIVVDDASRDETRRAIASIADSRIRYLRHDQNRGGSAARNTGIRAASGDFIAFLDDDDEWEPCKVQEQLCVLRDFDAVLCTSNERGNRIKKFSRKKEVSVEDLRAGKFTAGGTGVLMARADVLKGLEFDEALPRCQDWDLFIRLADRCRIGYLNKALVRYNEGSHDRISNAILNLPALEIERRLVILEKHRSFFGNKWYRRHLASFLLYGVKHRNDKWRHLSYTMRRCGVIPVARALLNRIYQKLTGAI